MGANHDGDNGNNCRYEDQFLMAWKNDPGSGVNNLHTFSPCSINYFDDTVQRLDTAMKDKNCLKVSARDNGEFAEHLKTLPGQKFSVDQQCQFVFGPGSYFCSAGEESDEKVCEEMFCKNLDEGQCKGGKMYRAYDGTPCGNKRWCMGGKCVADSNAPTGRGQFVKFLKILKMVILEL
ncbi:hypothetical protein HELRODRAFT_182174 [Helobdella robusta]|uniref:ADAMTS cysteine-rich domain-containing protein n=1 Tax=Helobdella robusta TaxID=6412 RepID=T1FHV4_HELRO|nr:hypothetical protein HELRODRAFT_182174 [Helobdella robusta]ESN91202.1 hypothetical protein HELRODRAFT_182174 [Helobdella robusta]